MFQQTILIGRVCKVKPGATAGGTSACQYVVVTNKSVKDSATGDFKEYDEFHRCISYGKAADHVSEKYQPGDLLKLEGELRTRSWDDGRTGEKRYATELVVDSFPTKLPRYWTKANTSGAKSNNQPMAQAAGQDFDPQNQAFDGFDDDVPL